MESSLSGLPTNASPKAIDNPGLKLGQYKSRAREEIELTLIAGAAKRNEDKVDVSFQDLYKALSLSAKQIVDKINALLGNKLPDGVQSLKPEDVTPEATAERIVKGSTAFFDIFAKQNPNLSGEELLNRFMDTIRGGIAQGYGEAFRILEGLGAFEYEGVKKGVEETKRLIDEKLAAYETSMREKLGLQPLPDLDGQVADVASREIVASAGRLSVQA